MFPFTGAAAAPVDDGGDEREEVEVEGDGEAELHQKDRDKYDTYITKAKRVTRGIGAIANARDQTKKRKRHEVAAAAAAAPPEKKKKKSTADMLRDLTDTLAKVPTEGQRKRQVKMSEDDMEISDGAEDEEEEEEEEEELFAEADDLLFGPGSRTPGKHWDWRF